MGLITRHNKGGLLTNTDMDDNLIYLEDLSIDKSIGVTGSQVNIADSRIQSVDVYDDINFICENATIGSYKLLLNHYNRASITFGDNIIWSEYGEYTYPDYVDMKSNPFIKFDDSTTCITKQPDGKILVGGGFTTFKNKNTYNIIRFNTDFTIDETFNSRLDGSVSKIVVQTDGKILVGGNFTSYNGILYNNIVRLNSDGSLDISFIVGTGFDGSIYDILIDDKILVGGNFTSYNGNSCNYITRLNSDGSFDSTFDIGTGFDAIVYRFSSSHDDKILIGGSFTSYNGNSCSCIVRLNLDGSFDSTFNIGTGFDYSPLSFVIKPDEYIIVGSFTRYKGLICNHIVKINTDGDILSQYDSHVDFPGFTDNIRSVVELSDGSLLITGEACAYQTLTNKFDGFTKILPDESMDSNYYCKGGWLELPQTDIILVGNYAITRCNSNNCLLKHDLINNVIGDNGSLDYDFIGLNGFNDQVRTTESQSDGKILVGGDFGALNLSPNKYDAVSRNIMRINIDGSFDYTFKSYPGFDDYVYKVCIQSDGKILVGGIFTSYNGNSCNRIARLNSDGSFDSTFNIGTGFDSSYIHNMVICNDGRIIVSTYATSYNGNPFNGSVILNSDGSIYTTLFIDNLINTFKIQLDGKILIGGSFTTINGYTKNYIARLNSDYSIDNTFVVNTTINAEVYSVELLSNGKIIIGGSFTDGSNYNYIARLISDGSLDTTFNIGTGFNSQVLTLSIMDDDKIVAGGQFSTFNSIPQQCLSILNHDGSLCDSLISRTTYTSIITSSKKIGNNVIIGYVGDQSTKPGLSRISITKDSVYPITQTIEFMYDGEKLIAK